MAHDVPLTKPLIDNDAVVTAPPEIVRPPLAVTKVLEFNHDVVVFSLHQEDWIYFGSVDGTIY